MKKLSIFLVIAFLSVPFVVHSAILTSSVLELNVDISVSNGLTLTFVPGKGENGSGAWIYTNVGGSDDLQSDDDGYNDNQYRH